MFFYNLSNSSSSRYTSSYSSYNYKPPKTKTKSLQEQYDELLKRLQKKQHIYEIDLTKFSKATFNLDAILSLLLEHPYKFALSINVDDPLITASVLKLLNTDTCKIESLAISTNSKSKGPKELSYIKQDLKNIIESQTCKLTTLKLGACFGDADLLEILSKLKNNKTISFLSADLSDIKVSTKLGELLVSNITLTEIRGVNIHATQLSRLLERNKNLRFIVKKLSETYNSNANQNAAIDKDLLMLEINNVWAKRFFEVYAVLSHHFPQIGHLFYARNDLFAAWFALKYSISNQLDNTLNFMAIMFNNQVEYFSEKQHEEIFKLTLMMIAKTLLLTLPAKEKIKISEIDYNSKLLRCDNVINEKIGLLNLGGDSSKQRKYKISADEKDALLKFLDNIKKIESNSKEPNYKLDESNVKLILAELTQFLTAYGDMFEASLLANTLYEFIVNDKIFFNNELLNELLSKFGDPKEQLETLEDLYQQLIANDQVNLQPRNLTQKFFGETKSNNPLVSQVNIDSKVFVMQQAFVDVIKNKHISYDFTDIIKKHCLLDFVQTARRRFFQIESNERVFINDLLKINNSSTLSSFVCCK